jgi:hypothetical protein
MSSPTSQSRPLIALVYITRPKGQHATYGFKGAPKTLPSSSALKDRKVKKDVKHAVKRDLTPKPRCVIVARVEHEFSISQDVVYPLVAGFLLVLVGALLFFVSAGSDSPWFRGLVDGLAGIAFWTAGATFSRGVGDERYLRPNRYWTGIKGLMTILGIVILGILLSKIGANVFTDAFATTFEAVRSGGASYLWPTAWDRIAIGIAVAAGIVAFLRPLLWNRAVSRLKGTTLDVGRP